MHQLLRDFELMDYVNRKVEHLTESGRRRLLVALHLVRDPGNSISPLIEISLSSTDINRRAKS